MTVKTEKVRATPQHADIEETLHQFFKLGFPALTKRLNISTFLRRIV